MDQSSMEDVSSSLMIRPDKDCTQEDLGPNPGPDPGPDLGLHEPGSDLLNQWHSVHFLLLTPGNVLGVACKIFQNAVFVIIVTPKSLFQMMKQLLTQVWCLFYTHLSRNQKYLIRKDQNQRDYFASNFKYNSLTLQKRWRSQPLVWILTEETLADLQSTG